MVQTGVYADRCVAIGVRKGEVFDGHAGQAERAGEDAEA